MLEIPESTTIARQMNETVRGRKIRSVIANASPHKFAFYHGDPDDYDALLTGQVVGDSLGIGAMVEIAAGDRRIVFGDGANLRFYREPDEAPSKHQVLIEFVDGSVLVCTVRMYGAALAFVEGGYESKYHRVAKEKPQPLIGAFDRAYFDTLFAKGSDKLSAKAFLATEQRIPGLGNGVLQDILFRAGVHPRTRMSMLSGEELDGLFHSVKDVLADMTIKGGRDTERDLFGKAGGYITILSKNTAGKPCPVCGTKIQKAAYMGGTVYWCPECQPLTQ